MISDQKSDIIDRSSGGESYGSFMAFSNLNQQHPMNSALMDGNPAGDMHIPNPTTKNNGADGHHHNRVLEQTQRWSFLAGILYVILIICGILAEVKCRGSVIDWDDPYGTIQNMKQENSSLLRWAFLLDVIMSTCDVALSILLGQILVSSGANVTFSLLVAVFRLLQQAVLATNLLHMITASLLVDPSFPVADLVADLFPTSNNKDGGNNNNDEFLTTTESLAYIFLLMHKYGYLLALIFFGISMFILGYVIVRWGVFPTWIGYFHCISGLAYMLDSFLFFLKSGYNGQATSLLMVPVLITEIGFTICLLLRKQTLAKTMKNTSEI